MSKSRPDLSPQLWYSLVITLPHHKLIISPSSLTPSFKLYCRWLKKWDTVSELVARQMRLSLKSVTQQISSPWNQRSCLHSAHCRNTHLRYMSQIHLNAYLHIMCIFCEVSLMQSEKDEHLYFAHKFFAWSFLIMYLFQLFSLTEIYWFFCYYLSLFLDNILL